MTAGWFPAFETVQKSNIRRSSTALSFLRKQEPSKPHKSVRVSTANTAWRGFLAQSCRWESKHDCADHVDIRTCALLWRWLVWLVDSCLRDCAKNPRQAVLHVENPCGFGCFSGFLLLRLCKKPTTLGHILITALIHRRCWHFKPIHHACKNTQ